MIIHISMIFDQILIKTNTSKSITPKKIAKFRFQTAPKSEENSYRSITKNQNKRT